MLRCKRCGGLLTRIVTDINGKGIFQCHTGLTHYDFTGHGQEHRIETCGLVHDDKGKILDGYVAYVTNNEVKTLAVVEGIARR
jgi:hypothetical protein